MNQDVLIKILKIFKLFGMVDVVMDLLEQVLLVYVQFVFVLEILFKVEVVEWDVCFI